ncbi:ECF RNA polymerase sigma factor SigE [bacterium HR15]|nr:ECF RNA polymerase sigma factor SigE [bacterium HR15]
MGADEEQKDRWLEAAQQGDEQAIDRLLAHYRPLVFRYLRPRLRNEEDCHDLTQEVLIRVAQALPHTVLQASFEQWLFRIAANCLRTFYQQRSKIIEIPLADLPDLQGTIGFQPQETELIEQVARQQVQQQLHAILAQVCSANEQQVILLHAEGESLEAIAQRLHLNRSTTRTHLMRGRAKVVAYIIQYEPSLVGGTEGIERAIARLRAEGGPREQLTMLELEALRRPGRNQKRLRNACLKVARFLAV